jgi:regulation of enolase protein 1 (concanavalin A-like superfamily)
LAEGDYKVVFPEPVEDPEPPIVVDPNNVQSDDFSSGELAPFWTLVNPNGGSVDVEVADGEATMVISVPSGDFDSNPADFSNDAVRVLQSVADADFQVETAFLSTPEERFEIQGIMVEENADNWIRFDIAAFGSGEWRVFAGYADDGTSQVVSNRPISDPSEAQAMRVTRTGDDWVFEISSDGVSWREEASFTHAGINPSGVGPYAGTLGEDDGYEAKVDYFYNSQDRIPYDDASLTLQTGKDFVVKDAGDPNDDAIDSDVNPNGETDVISLGRGETLTDVDAGVKAPAEGVIGDVVWFDSFGDGVLNDFEARASGVTVQLKDDAGTVIAETVTALDGSYLFQNVEAGVYSVAFVLPDGFEFTDANVGDDTRDSDADPVTGETALFTLADGEVNVDVDAGLRKCGLIEGTSQGDANSPVGGNDLLVGCDEADQIFGFSGEDTLIGNGGDDELYGSFDADILIGGEGDDILDGGSGVTGGSFGSSNTDIAVYNGVQADYDVQDLGAGQFRVEDLNAANGDEGVDLLTNMEIIRFDDGDVIL